MINASIQHISSDTEYDNLVVETKEHVDVTSSALLGTRAVFYQIPREEIQGIADKLNKWLEAN